MESLQTLMHKSKIVQSFDVRELLGEAWGEALQKLAEMGIESKAAQSLLNDALEREQLAGYPPSSDERIDRARVALDTVVDLYHIPPDTPLKSAPIFIISLAQVDVDDDVQIRVRGVDADRVADYARDMVDGDEFPPIVCFFERLPSGNGHKLWLADGFHRLAAAKSNSLHHAISARVTPGTHGDAVEYATTCNARHGLPMTNADKKRAVRRLLHLHPDLSSREIARRVGCSHNTVEAVRGEMAASGQFDQIDEAETRTVTRGDSTYEYTPPPTPDYAEVWQIENCIRNYLDVRFGRKGLADFNAQPRIDCLQTIIQFDYEQLPERLLLPDHYRKSDLKQAVHNVLEQVKQRERARSAEDNGDDENFETPDASVVTWDTNSSPSARSDDNVRGEPFYTALISGSTTSLRRMLEGCDLDQLDSCAALERALVNIFGGNNPARRVIASRVILDLILDSVEDLQAGLDLDETDEPASLPEGTTVSESIGCPECGGPLLRISRNGGPERLVCRDCGCVAEPEVLETQGA